jgi:hypothetical protein
VGGKLSLQATHPDIARTMQAQQKCFGEFQESGGFIKFQEKDSMIIDLHLGCQRLALVSVDLHDSHTAFILLRNQL